MSNTVANGGCYCGAVEYRITGVPEETGICYCEDCRRISAAPGVAWFSIKRGQFEVTKGQPAELRSSPPVIRLFCGECGTNLAYTHTGREDEIDVTTCSLSDPMPFVRGQTTGAEHKPSWAP